MTKNEFALLTDYLVETYGVHSYLENEDDIDEENLWFECGECGEPILFEDYGDDEELSCRFCCPICGNPFRQ